MLEIVDTVPWHVASIRERLSAASTRACEHVYGVDLRSVLDLTWTMSDRCWTLQDKELPIVITGVYEESIGVGNPWTFLSREVDDHRVSVACWSKRMLEKYQRTYAILELYLDYENKKSIRWHKWLGFVFDLPAPHGPLGTTCVHGVRMEL